MGYRSNGTSFPQVGRIEELVKYCEEIACGAPALPFYFYHIPAFNGAYLSMVAFLEAVDGRIPNFLSKNMTADEENKMKAELEEIRFFERCNKF